MAQSEHGWMKDVTTRRQVLRTAGCALATSAWAAGPLQARERNVKAPALLLARTWMAGRSPQGYLVSEKFDGVRAHWDGHVLRFRGGGVVPAPASWLAGLPPEPLDGELWLGRGQFDALSGLVRREQGPAADWSAVQYQVFELPGAPGSFAERAQRLQAMVAARRCPCLQAPAQQPVADAVALQAWLDEVVGAGGEGLVLHQADAPYRTGRGGELWKFKPVADAEAQVLAHQPGQGKYSGQLGALQVRNERGQVFFIGSGLTDAQRREPPPVGSWVTYSWRARRTPTGSRAPACRALPRCCACMSAGGERTQCAPTLGYRAAMSEMSFFWHDYETFGRVPRRDRPSQFAGVRTDADLNEIEAPLMSFCQPVPDYLPDPESCLLTGILPQQCQAQGVPEPEFARQIEAKLAAPGTIGVGYNSIRFDDEVTRHLFWRNFIDPYAREYKNDCGRWDLLDVVRCMYALRPDGLQWPRHEDGRPSFKLEHLSAANGLVHEAAHDALSDVRATIALARLIRQAQPRLWDFCLKLRKKDAVWEEIGVGRPFLHISGMYGPERGCLALVWPLAPHPTNKNELIVWDLASDPGELFTLGAAAIRERMFTKADQLPEGVTRLPIKTIHINKSPVVIGNLKILSPELAERWGVDVALALQRAEQCAHQSHLLAGLWDEVFQRPAAGPSDVDEDLYGGFIGPQDRQRLDRLRRLSPSDPAWERASFDDPRLGELVFRWRGRHAPDTLTDAERERWQAHCAARLHEGEGGGLALADYLEKLDVLAAAADAAGDERAQGLLAALYEYAEQIAPELD